MSDTYAYTSLNPLSDQLTFAHGINDTGQIVGYSDLNLGFLYIGGSYATLDDPLATQGTPQGASAWGINATGQIVGTYSRNWVSHGFLYSGGSYTTLDDPASNPDGTQAFGINDAGQIVGFYTGSDGLDHSFLYSGGSYTTLDDPLATQFTRAFGINDAGQIVGMYNDNSGTHGFLYSGGSYTTLDDPLATQGTSAFGINDAGQIVGYYIDNSGEHGFLYSDGSYATLDDPAANSLYGYGTEAFGINDLGQIVGQYAHTDINGVTSFSSFLATPIVPTVAVSIDNTDVNVANDTATVTFAFSEAPTSFALADTSAVGGTLSNLQQTDPTHYTATFTGAANTDISTASVSVTTMSSVKFSSAVATFYEVQNNWAPSQMIDGIFTGPPPSPGQDATYGGVNGWSVMGPNGAEGADALLTLATPLSAGQYTLTFNLYQNYYGNPGHLLGDFELGACLRNS